MPPEHHRSTFLSRRQPPQKPAKELPPAHSTFAEICITSMHPSPPIELYLVPRRYQRRFFFTRMPDPRRLHPRCRHDIGSAADARPRGSRADRSQVHAFQRLPQSKQLITDAHASSKSCRSSFGKASSILAITSSNPLRVIAKEASRNMDSHRGDRC